MRKSVFLFVLFIVFIVIFFLFFSTKKDIQNVIDERQSIEYKLISEASKDSKNWQNSTIPVTVEVVNEIDFDINNYKVKEKGNSFLLSLGEKDTTGYGVRIKDIELKSNVLLVYSEVAIPERGDFVNGEKVNPHVFFSVSETISKNLSLIVVKNENNKTVGYLKLGQSKNNPSNNNIDYKKYLKNTDNNSTPKEKEGVYVPPLVDKDQQSDTKDIDVPKKTEVSSAINIAIRKPDILTSVRTIASHEIHFLYQEHNEKKDEFELNIVEQNIFNGEKEEISLDDYVREIGLKDGSLLFSKYLSEKEVLFVVSSNDDSYLIIYNKDNHKFDKFRMKRNKDFKIDYTNKYFISKETNERLNITDIQNKKNIPLEFKNSEIANFGWINADKFYVVVNTSSATQVLVIDKIDTSFDIIKKFYKEEQVYDVAFFNGQIFISTDKGIYSDISKNFLLISKEVVERMETTANDLIAYGKNVFLYKKDKKEFELVLETENIIQKIYQYNSNKFVYIADNKMFLYSNDKKYYFFDVYEETISLNSIKFFNDKLVITFKSGNKFKSVLVDITNKSILDIVY